MWIKLTMRNHVIGDGKILVNTDNVSCVMTGQNILYKGETLVCFSGDREDCISVEESIDKVEEILRGGLRAGGNYDRRERKQKEQPRSTASTASTAQSTAQSTNLIDRQAAIDALDCINGVEEVLRSLPSVQPERAEGEWVQIQRCKGDAQPDLECPFCKHRIGWFDMGRYCAGCGAKLEGGAG